MLKQRSLDALAFQDHDFIYELIDQIENSNSVILEYMNDDVLNLLKKRQLLKTEVKCALKAMFKALVTLHNEDIVHTGTF